MKTTVILMFVALCITACNAQEKSKKSDKQVVEKSEIKNIPKESWMVNKELDDEGNVIRYDSTYTWSYTNVEGDSVSVNVDSVRKSFHRYLNQELPATFERSFMNPNWNDTLFHSEFFKDDFFQNRWERDFYDMDDMFQRMDSLRNHFFQQNYPGMMKPSKSQDGKSIK